MYTLLLPCIEAFPHSKHGVFQVFFVYNYLPYFGPSICQYDKFLGTSLQYHDQAFTFSSTLRLIHYIGSAKNEANAPASSKIVVFIESGSKVLV